MPESNGHALTQKEEPDETDEPEKEEKAVKVVDDKMVDRECDAEKRKREMVRNMETTRNLAIFRLQTYALSAVSINSDFGPLWIETAAP